MTMTFDEYEALAFRTLMRGPISERGLVWNTLGLCGEAGEVMEAANDSRMDIDMEQARTEVGDVLWYVAALAHNLGGDLETCILLVQEKPVVKASMGLDFPKGGPARFLSVELEDLFIFTGRVADLIKKLVFHKKPIAGTVVLKHLGKVVVCLANIAWCLGTTLEVCALLQLDKTAKRYPNGFTTEDANKERAEPPHE